MGHRSKRDAEGGVRMAEGRALPSCPGAMRWGRCGLGPGARLGAGQWHRAGHCPHALWLARWMKGWPGLLAGQGRHDGTAGLARLAASAVFPGPCRC